MSRENLERFLKEVAKDNDLQSKITNHIDRDALIALGAEQGLTFDAEDIEQALSRMGSQRTIDLIR